MHTIVGDSYAPLLTPAQDHRPRPSRVLLERELDYSILRVLGHYHYTSRLLEVEALHFHSISRHSSWYPGFLSLFKPSTSLPPPKNINNVSRIKYTHQP